MCGIIGLFLKDKSLEPKLDKLLITMTDRGPDSAQIAIYGHEAGDKTKLAVQSSNPDADFDGLDTALAAEIGSDVTLRRKDTYGSGTDGRFGRNRPAVDVAPQHPGHERR